jgi:hypothetical protein
MLEQWNAMDPDAQKALLAFVIGAVLWLLQKVWSNAPWLPGLGEDTAVWIKRAVAIVLAVIAGIVAGQGDLVKTVISISVALMTSQTIHLWTKKVDESTISKKM